MAVRALLEVTDCPLPLAVDLYEKTIIPSICEESEEAYNNIITELSYDFMASDSEEKCAYTDWGEANNQFGFSAGYINIFEETPEYAAWIAYEALIMIFSLYPDHNAGYMQSFAWKERRFLVCCEGKRVTFFTPNEL